MFDRCFVINLDRSVDRIVAFRQGMPPLIRNMAPKRWSAVDGWKLTPPPCWTAGHGLWGGLMSHLAILNHCIQHDMPSYLVFEDDCVFDEHFEANLSTFVDGVPDDWGMLYLGGQLLNTFEFPPKRINEHVIQAFNVNRTHAIAIHSRAYAAVYQHWTNLPFAHGEAFDTHLGHLHESQAIKVYVPNDWLCRQRAGVSLITHNFNNEAYWPAPHFVVQAFEMRNQPPTEITIDSGLALRDPSETSHQT